MPPGDLSLPSAHRTGLDLLRLILVVDRGRVCVRDIMSQVTSCHDFLRTGIPLGSGNRRPALGSFLPAFTTELTIDALVTLLTISPAHCHRLEG